MALTGMIQPALEQWFLKFLEDKADHLRPLRGCCRVHPSWRPKVKLGNSPFTFMNRLMKIATCLGVLPVGNSYFIEPGSSSRIFLLWPTGKAARLEILPIATPAVPWPSPSLCIDEETWTAGMIMETSIPYWGGRSDALQFDEATYSTRQIKPPHFRQ